MYGLHAKRRKKTRWSRRLPYGTRLDRVGGKEGYSALNRGSVAALPAGFRSVARITRIPRVFMMRPSP